MSEERAQSPLFVKTYDYLLWLIPQTLRQADKTLTKLRLYTRLSYDLQCINMGKFEHSARRLDEIGRLLGGWQRATTKQ
jgi:hypothetical protein